MVLRYFAYLDRYRSFDKSVREFLNAYYLRERRLNAGKQKKGADPSLGVFPFFLSLPPDAIWMLQKKKGSQENPANPCNLWWVVQGSNL